MVARSGARSNQRRRYGMVAAAAAAAAATAAAATAMTCKTHVRGIVFGEK